jgi:hypothetical protein
MAICCGAHSADGRRYDDTADCPTVAGNPDSRRAFRDWLVLRERPDAREASRFVGLLSRTFWKTGANLCQALSDKTS